MFDEINVHSSFFFRNKWGIHLAKHNNFEVYKMFNE